MKSSIPSIRTIHSISAMDFRTCPGTFLDKCEYLNESFIIRRGNKQKAVLIPYLDFQHFQLLKQFRRRLVRQG